MRVVITCREIRLNRMAKVEAVGFLYNHMSANWWKRWYWVWENVCA